MFYYCVVTKQINRNINYITASCIPYNTYSYSYIIVVTIYQTSSKFPKIIKPFCSETFATNIIVAIIYSNNIFCCNKVFLIIIIFYCNKMLLQRNFCCDRLLPQTFLQQCATKFVCCNKGLLQQVWVYYNKIFCYNRVFSCSVLMFWTKIRWDFCSQTCPCWP